MRTPSPWALLAVSLLSALGGCRHDPIVATAPTLVCPRVVAATTSDVRNVIQRATPDAFGVSASASQNGLLATSYGDEVQLWDVTRGRLLRVVRARKATRAVLSSDGKRLLLVDKVDDGYQARVLDTMTGLETERDVPEVVASAGATTARWIAIAPSPSSTEARGLQLLDADLRPLAMLPLPDGLSLAERRPPSIVTSPRGEAVGCVATASGGRRFAVIWKGLDASRPDAVIRARLIDLPAASPRRLSYIGLAVGPGGDTVAYALNYPEEPSVPTRVFLVGNRPPALLFEQEGFLGLSKGIVFSGDGRTLLTADGTEVTLHRTDTGARIARVSGARSALITTTGDPQRAVIVSDGMRIVDVRDGRTVRPLGVRLRPARALFPVVGGVAQVIAENQALVTTTWSARGVPSYRHWQLRSAADQDEQLRIAYDATVISDGSVIVPNESKPVRVFTPGADAPREVALPHRAQWLATSTDGSRLLVEECDVRSGAKAGACHASLIDTGSGQRTPLNGKPFAGGGKLSNHGLFSSDGRRAFVLSDPQHGEEAATTTLLRWDLATGSEDVRLPVNCYEGYENPSLSASPTGRRFACGDNEDSVDVWESEAGASRKVASWDAAAGKRLQDVLLDDAHGAILATAEGLQRVDDDGRTAARSADSLELGHLVRGPGSALVARAFGGSLHVFDANTLTMRATLVAFADDEGLAFTPNGAYRGSAEAATRVALVFSTPLEAAGFEQFVARFDRPDIVERRLAGELVDIERAVARPPSVRVLDGARVNPDSPRLALEVSSTSRVTKVRAYAEGRLAGEASVCMSQGRVELPVTLLPGRNRVTVKAFDQDGVASDDVTFDVEGRGSARPPELWVVATGIDRYPRLPPGAQLQAAAADARALRDAFASQAGAGRPFAALHATVLEDEAATTDAIGAALNGLAAMRPEDLAIVFFAGHGLQSRRDGDMVLVTAASAPLASGGLSATLGWGPIGTALRAARGRVVVLLDACHSGHITQDLVVPNGSLAAALGTSDRAGVLVFAAAKGRQPSFEPDAARGFELVSEGIAPAGPATHGFFTAAILAALGSAETDADGDGRIELSELVDRVSRDVSSATHERQTPWVARRELFGDFAVAGVAAKP